MHRLDITYREKFFREPSKLFEQIRTSMLWDERMHSRRTASFGIAYNYSGISYPDAPMPDFIVSMADQVAFLLGHTFNNCLINYYEDGHSTMGFHSDSIQELIPNTWIAIVSLGDARSLTFRNRTDTNQRVAISLECGSVLLMSQNTQMEWKHALLAMPNAGPRISVTFRAIQQEEKPHKP